LRKKGYPSLARQQQSYGREPAILKYGSNKKYEQPKQMINKNTGIFASEGIIAN
jgi:hypothetical protein